MYCFFNNTFIKMKSTQKITLCLLSSVVLAGCEEKTGPTFETLEACEKIYPTNVCLSARAKAWIKDGQKQERTLEQCHKIYASCDVWRSGYAPTMAGFRVLNGEDGEPHYVMVPRKRWGGGSLWFFWSIWDSLPSDKSGFGKSSSGFLGG